MIGEKWIWKEKGRTRSPAKEQSLGREWGLNFRFQPLGIEEIVD
ncbi:hypothetical protein SAMN06295967_101239 [Belliella buryatensis]|uniref:Uncharacterized protein n=1 Tax=Belliella buryatensis TaxID=1500549 RepID=A0A239ALM4_9BACT|nr:hypothetical protein SAMN06295967_101239 [Belliella buryatensis]